MNTFGHFFRITTFGESHGPVVGVVIDGCPAGLHLHESDFNEDLARRKTGQSQVVSQRKEPDKVEILSGVFEGKTMGSPLCLMVRNKDAKSKDYYQLKNTYRPGHADYTWHAKFGVKNWHGGGRSSARETIARVMAGVVAKKILFQLTDLEIMAFVDQIGKIKANLKSRKITKEQIESSCVRCPDKQASQKMKKSLEELKNTGDTVGGIIRCIINNPPVGLGEPLFHKLKARLSQAMMSLPAAVGVDFGCGFESLGFTGSEYNDEFFSSNKTDIPKIKTKTNNSGGIQGGITNGMPLYFRTVFKPVSTLMKAQETVNTQGEVVILKMKGRHDPCVVPRAVVIVEAMAALVLVDALLAKRLNKIG